MKKEITIIEINHSVAKAFADNVDLSLRKLAEYVDVNYNSLLKAAKKPIVGEVYDPAAVNYDEIETYLRKRDVDVDNLNWGEISELSQSASSTRKKEDINWQPGMKFTLRGTIETAIFEVIFVTTSHIVFMEVGGTQPRVMSWNTFDHQTPRKAD